MKHLPPIGKAKKEEIDEYLRASTDKESSRRRQLFRNSEFNRLYIQNEQWLEDAIGVGGVVGSAGRYQSAFLQPIMDGDDFAPRPVLNECLPIVQNEVARMVLSGSKLKVPPRDSGPEIKKAAQLAQDVLQANDSEINFKAMKVNFVRSMCLDGIGIYLSEQQTDYTNTIKAPKALMACTSCAWKASVQDHDSDETGAPVLAGLPAMAAARFGATPLNFMGPDSAMLEGQLPQARMEKCPECGGSLTNRTAEGDDEDDYAGNCCHDDIPKGGIFVANMAAMDWFPHGNGRLDPDGTVRRWASEEIVSLDWLSQFYEQGYKVKGGDQELVELSRWHPQGYEDGTYVQDTSDRDFQDYAVLRRAVRLPYFEKDENDKRKYYDRGRYTVMAGDVILIDDVLMLEDERSDTMVPRCKVHTAPWEPIAKSVWGNALMTYLRSPQDNENTAFAQAIEARHNHASPKMWLGPGQNIEFLGQAYGSTSNSVYRWTGGAEPPLMRDGHALNEQWRFEVQEYKEALQRVSSSRDVEHGNAPSGVTAAQALRLLAEAATVTRGPRIALMNAAVESLGKHRLQLMGILFKEPRDFVAGGRGDRLSVQSFTGLDLMGQCDVKIDIEPFIESAVMKSQATSESLANGTLILRTAGDRARYLALQGVPADLAPGEGLQVESATDEWLKFVKNRDEDGKKVLTFGAPPIVKEDFDNNEVHAEQHTIDLMSWEGQEIRENWDKLALALAGWKDEWEKFTQAEAALKMDPPGDTPPEPPRSPIDGTVEIESVKLSVKEWKLKKALEDKIAEMPKLTELRIFELWKKILASKSIDLNPTPEGTMPTPGIEPRTNEDKEKDLALLRWLAHIEGHRDEIKRAQATAMPQTAEPIKPQTGGQAPGMVA